MQELIIDQEFKALIPSLTSEEYNQLEMNLIHEGCRDSLVTWNGILIDGHNRYEICTKNNIKFNAVAKEFQTREDVIEWIIRNQFGRRNLPNYERGKLALRLESVIRERAKENQKLAGSKHTGNQYTNKMEGKQKSDEVPFDIVNKTNTRKELAKIAGVSHDTIEKIKVIEREATPEQKQDLTKGNKSINKVFREIKPKAAVKTCSICGVEKPLSDFYTNKGQCKKCLNSIRNSGLTMSEIKESNEKFPDEKLNALYEEMKTPCSCEEEHEENICSSIITELDTILNNFNTSINKFTFMQTQLKSATQLNPILTNNIKCLEKIINLIEE